MFARNKYILLSLCAIFLLSATVFYAQPRSSIITAEELQSRLNSEKTAFLIDVRQQDEYDAGHIDGAKLIPLSTLADHASELPKDRDIVVYCKSGRRSAEALSFLQAQGFKNVVSLSGGFQEWAARQDAKTKEMQVCALSTGCQNK